MKPEENGKENPSSTASPAPAMLPASSGVATAPPPLLKQPAPAITTQPGSPLKQPASPHKQQPPPLQQQQPRYELFTSFNIDIFQVGVGAPVQVGAEGSRRSSNVLTEMLRLNRLNIVGRTFQKETCLVAGCCRVVDQFFSSLRRSCVRAPQQPAAPRRRHRPCRRKPIQNRQFLFSMSYQ